MKGSVIVIGGGVGGLSAAIRLASRGFHVRLFEKNPRVGGKLNLWEARHPDRPADRPFRFDTGPSLLTLPFVLGDLFEAGGEDVRNWLPIVKLNPIARFCWADGERFELHSDPAAMQAELRRFAPGDLDGWNRLLSHGRKIWELSAELFLFHAPEQILRAGRGFSLKAAVGMLTTPIRIGVFANYARLVNRHLSNARLRQVMYQYATYSGSSPFRAAATLAVIPHAELHFGGWYPQGGMYQIAIRLEALARRLGVKIRTGCPAEKILIERATGAHVSRGRHARRVVGVRLASGEELHCDAIIANSDVVYTYRQLIDETHRPHWPAWKLDRLDPGGSGMVLLLGIEGEYPQLAHHNKFMPADYTSDLRAMFETKTIPDDPCIYVCASTRTDPSQAPPGCENLFILCSAPPLDGTLDWDLQGPRYEQQIIRALETRWGLADLSRRIVVRRRITPADMQRLYHANAGSIYGISGNSRRTAFLRPANRDRKIRGLYFAGGATHPGGGLPLVALSGKIAAELLQEDFG